MMKNKTLFSLTIFFILSTFLLIIISSNVSAYCGDTILDPGEQCDQNWPNSCSCGGGYNGLNYCSSCRWAGCGFCESCGDGKKNGYETCDGGSQSCTDFNGYTGTQSCFLCTGYSNCYSTEMCGDGWRNGRELCDGDTVSCSTVAGYSGTQRCGGLCNGYDQCYSYESCGDNVRNGNEQCDSNTETCFVNGYPGSKSCDLWCSWNNCVTPYYCGDSITIGPEQCDGNTRACTTAAGYAGTESCTGSCSWSGTCVPSESCGDNVRNGNEQCDGSGTICITNGYIGSKSCSASCTLNACTTTQHCGDNIRNGFEICDGTSGSTCANIYGAEYIGTPGCRTDCSAFVQGTCRIALDYVCKGSSTGSCDIFAIPSLSWSGYDCGANAPTDCSTVESGNDPNICGGTINCKDSSLQSNSACTAAGCTWQPNVCGDSVMNVAAGEQCDDGNLNNYDGCSSSCLKTYVCKGSSTQSCNGYFVDNCETECDTAPAGCYADQFWSECYHSCGGIIECKDSSLQSNSACTAAGCGWQPNVCGDGVVNVLDGEECDDGNSVVGDGCSSCKLEYICKGPSTRSCGEFEIPSLSWSGYDCSADAPLNCYTVEPAINPNYCDGTIDCSAYRGAKCTTLGCSWVPSICGDNIIDPNRGDECDGSTAYGKTCANYNVYSDPQGNGADVPANNGNLICGGCKLNSAGCGYCSNGIREPAEICDGSDINGKVCSQYNSCSNANGNAVNCNNGVVSCTNSCNFDYSKCGYCGNNVKEFSETCDGTTLNSMTCTGVKNDGRTWIGTLGCNTGCSGYDVSRCTTCGNTITDSGEQCDYIPPSSVTFSTTASMQRSNNNGANYYGVCGDTTSLTRFCLENGFNTATVGATPITFGTPCIKYVGGWNTLIAAYVYPVTCSNNIPDTSVGCTNTCQIKDCTILSASITPSSCGSSSANACNVGTTWTVNVRYTGNCALTEAIQVDAASSDNSCKIQFSSGSMKGMTGSNTLLNTPLITTTSFTYTVPTLPLICGNKVINNITGISFRYDGGVVVKSLPVNDLSKRLLDITEDDLLGSYPSKKVLASKDVSEKIDTEYFGIGATLPPTILAYYAGTQINPIYLYNIECDTNTDCVVKNSLKPTCIFRQCVACTSDAQCPANTFCMGDGACGTCKITGIDIKPGNGCDIVNSACNSDNKLNITVNYTGDCSKAKSVQIDFASAYGSCVMNYNTPDSTNVISKMILLIFNPNLSSFTSPTNLLSDKIPSIPVGCNGQTLTLVASEAYSGLPIPLNKQSNYYSTTLTKGITLTNGSCGNYFVDTIYGEQCDVGPTDTADCYKCHWSICGDGMKQTPNHNSITEQCDLGGFNTNTACVAAPNTVCSYCNTTCSNITIIGPICGDGKLDAGEQCDYNTTSGSKTYPSPNATDGSRVVICDDKPSRVKYCIDNNYATSNEAAATHSGSVASCKLWNGLQWITNNSKNITTSVTCSRRANDPYDEYDPDNMIGQDGSGCSPNCTLRTRCGDAIAQTISEGATNLNGGPFPWLAQNGTLCDGTETYCESGYQAHIEWRQFTGFWGYLNHSKFWSNRWWVPDYPDFYVVPLSDTDPNYFMATLHCDFKYDSWCNDETQTYDISNLDRTFYDLTENDFQRGLNAGGTNYYKIYGDHNNNGREICDTLGVTHVVKAGQPYPGHAPCLDTCTIDWPKWTQDAARCGDGITQPQYGESCDSSNPGCVYCQLCSITNVAVYPGTGCDRGVCAPKDKVRVVINFTGDCSAARFAQVDINSTDGACNIGGQGAVIGLNSSEMGDLSIGAGSTSIEFNYTLNGTIPAKCAGKLMGVIPPGGAAFFTNAAKTLNTVDDKFYPHTQNIPVANSGVNFTIDSAHHTWMTCAEVRDKLGLTVLGQSCALPVPPVHKICAGASNCVYKNSSGQAACLVASLNLDNPAVTNYDGNTVICSANKTLCPQGFRYGLTDGYCFPALNSCDVGTDFNTGNNCSKLLNALFKLPLFVNITGDERVNGSSADTVKKCAKKCGLDKKKVTLSNECVRNCLINPTAAVIPGNIVEDPKYDLIVNSIITNCTFPDIVVTDKIGYYCGISNLFNSTSGKYLIYGKKNIVVN